jgi:hypothetical protein
MFKLKQTKTVLKFSACFILSHVVSAQADLPKSAALYYATPTKANITPYFDYYSSDRSNNLYDYRTENHAAGMILEYGINNMFSVGGKLAYGEENNTQSHILTGFENKFTSKGLIDPELFLNSHYEFEKFRVYGNIFGHASMENHKTASPDENGNLSSGGSAADIELATDAPLGPVTAGLLGGKTLWKDNRQVYDSSTYNKYQLKGGEFEKYKMYFELNSLSSLKPGFIYTYRKTDPSFRLLDNSNHEIFFDYGQNDSIVEFYSRFRLDASLILLGSVSQIDSVINPGQSNQESYKSYGLNLGLTIKY